MKMQGLAMLLVLGILPIALSSGPAEGGDTLNRIRGRGQLRCGVSDGVRGFSLKESDGRWTGMDADFCRALAAAVLEHPEKAVFVPLATPARFPSLKAGEIDVLVRNTTWTLEREAALEVMFTSVLYYDAQTFLVPVKSNVHALSDLNGATICVIKGTTHESNLVDYFHVQNWSYQPLIVESQDKAAEALFSGQCQAFTSERPQLTAMRLKAPGGPEEYTILPNQISKEPMGPAVRRGDNEWFTIVRWLVFALIRAEEMDLNQATVRSRLSDTADPIVQRWSELDGLVAKALGIPPGWGTRAVETVGNYGELFERNLGSQSTLKLERGMNNLWTRGGLMYAPPFH